MYRIYLVNFDYFAERTASNLAEAVAYAESICFECALYCGERIEATWSPIGGLRMIE